VEHDFVNVIITIIIYTVTFIFTLRIRMPCFKLFIEIGNNNHIEKNYTSSHWLRVGDYLLVFLNLTIAICCIC